MFSTRWFTGRFHFILWRNPDSTRLYSWTCKLMMVQLYDRNFEIFYCWCERHWRSVRIEPSPDHTKSGRSKLAPSSYSAALTTTSTLSECNGNSDSYRNIYVYFYRSCVSLLVFDKYWIPQEAYYSRTGSLCVCPGSRYLRGGTLVFYVSGEQAVGRPPLQKLEKVITWFVR